MYDEVGLEYKSRVQKGDGVTTFLVHLRILSPPPVIALNLIAVVSAVESISWFGNRSWVSIGSMGLVGSSMICYDQLWKEVMRLVVTSVAQLCNIYFEGLM